MIISSGRIKLIYKIIAYINTLWRLKTTTALWECGGGALHLHKMHDLIVSNKEAALDVLTFSENSLNWRHFEQF